MLAFLATIRLWLETNIHPAAPWALLTFGIWLAVYLTRKFLPQLWTLFDRITPDGMIGHVVQGLPSVGVGALLGVVLTGGDFATAWKGAIAGALAPVLHLLMKNYQGAVKAVAGAGVLFVVVGCSRPFHFSDPTLEDWAAKFCGEAAERHRTELQAEAKRTGLPLDVVLDVFRSACVFRVKRGANDAPEAGLVAVRMKPAAGAP